MDENFNEKGVVKTLGIMSKVPRSVLEDMQDDEDALIQHFIDSNKKQVIC